MSSLERATCATPARTCPPQRVTSAGRRKPRSRTASRAPWNGSPDRSIGSAALATETSGCDRLQTPGHFDVAIIGGGPGGYASALYGASAGLNIAMVENQKVGGTCLHVGCIPAKELLETAATFRHVANAKEYGIVTDQPTLEW